MAKQEREHRPTLDRLFSTQGAAAVANLKPETIRHYIRQHKLRAETLVGSDEYVIREADLNAWLATREAMRSQTGKGTDSSP